MTMMIRIRVMSTIGIFSMFILIQFSNVKCNQQIDCGCTDIPPGQEYNCWQQKEWGKCSRSWMINWDYCATTCQRCKCFGFQKCMDIPPDQYHSCEQQKRWGKCGEPWMRQKGYCDITCNRCPQENYAPFASYATNKNSVRSENTNSSVVIQTYSLSSAPPSKVFPVPLLQAPSPPFVNSCGCTDTAPGRSFMCVQQKAFGKCLRRWMLDKGHCAQTCDRCLCLPDENGDDTIMCTDIPPTVEHTCKEQKRFGKCQENWMMQQGYCAYTCGRCGQNTLQSGINVTPQSSQIPPETLSDSYYQIQRSFTLEDVLPVYSQYIPPDEEDFISFEDNVDIQIYSAYQKALDFQMLSIPEEEDEIEIQQVVASFVSVGFSQTPSEEIETIEGYISSKHDQLSQKPTATSPSDDNFQDTLILSQADNDEFQRSIQMQSPKISPLIVQDCKGTIMQVVAMKPQLTILNQMLTRSGLADKISRTIGGVTLFAPEDQAFREIIRSEGITLQDLFIDPLYSQEIIPKLLAYHVLPRQMNIDTLQYVSTYGTFMEGTYDNLVFVHSKEMVVVAGRFSVADIVEQDIVTCDGVIHITDDILLPRKSLLDLIDQQEPKNNESDGQTIINSPPYPNTFTIGNMRAATENPTRIPVMNILADIVLESKFQQSFGLQSNDDIFQSDTQCSNSSVLDILETLPNIGFLFQILLELEFEDEFEPPVTFFAPVDSAWMMLATKLGFAHKDELLLPENRETLENVLLYHIVPQLLFLEGLSPNTNVPVESVNEQLLYIENEVINGKESISIMGIDSGANLLDIEGQVNQGCNVSVHLVDAALLPFTVMTVQLPDVGDEPYFYPPPPPRPIVIPEKVLLTAPPGILQEFVSDEIINQTRSGQLSGDFIVNVTKAANMDLPQEIFYSTANRTGCRTLLEVIQSFEELSLLNALIQHADLAPLLNSTRVAYTLLAPTNNAINKLIVQLGARSQSLSDDKVLSNILGYHIVRDTYEKDDFEVGLEMPTLVAWINENLMLLVEDNEDIYQLEGEADPETKYILVGIGSEAKFLQCDIWACNSVMHIIDTVLLPVDTQ